MTERITLPEVVAALSLATDLAMGEQLESGLAICLRAVALAEAAGATQGELDETWYVALLRHVGCTADNAPFAELVGDEREFRHSVATADVTNPRAFMPLMLRHLVRTHGLFGAAAVFGRMARDRARFDEAVRAVCEVAELLAARLGLSDAVQEDLRLANERWDGKGFLRRRKEEEIPLAVRVVQIAECASVYAADGADAVTAVLRSRSGTAFDPRLVDVFTARASELLAAGEAPSLWEAALAAAPDELALHGERLDAALGAMAEFVDLKSPYTVGHSAGVAELAAAAASPLEADDVRRAALVHDLGRVGVSSTVWEKRDALTADDWERIRLHPYLAERILSRSPGLAELAAVASLHHERCDGSGYHRGVDARTLPQTARLLAAADAFHAMTEPRPHRAALTAEQATAELRAEAKRGCLDADAVEAVVAAAGGKPQRRRTDVAGLTSREVDVLRLLARGLSTKQIAAELTISPKTADTHIQHVYAKLGISTRAAASVFAMRHGYV
jgi:HD-GYP domain-containing protein (c-di-GMP phosphodiesterase class II)